MLICFDVDGTLETSNGPVKTSRLVSLKDWGHRVIIVSPSPHFPRYADTDDPVFPNVSGNDTRLENLLEAKQMFGSEEFYLYISDNPGDDEVAKQAGFSFMHPKDFR